MTRIELKSRVGADGTLSLTVPVGMADANREVIVTVEPFAPSSQPSPDREAWRQAIEETAGSIQDPTFVRHTQGDYEQREEWG